MTLGISNFQRGTASRVSSAAWAAKVLDAAESLRQKYLKPGRFQRSHASQILNSYIYICIHDI